MDERKAISISTELRDFINYLFSKFGGQCGGVKQE